MWKWKREKECKEPASCATVCICCQGACWIRIEIRTMTQQHSRCVIVIKVHPKKFRSPGQSEQDRNEHWFGTLRRFRIRPQWTEPWLNEQWPVANYTLLPFTAVFITVHWGATGGNGAVNSWSRAHNQRLFHLWLRLVLNVFSTESALIFRTRCTIWHSYVKH